MNISDYSIITKNDSPYSQTGRVQSGGRQRARNFTEEAEQQSQSQAQTAKRVDAPADATRVAPTRAVVPVSEVYSNQRRADYFQVEDRSRYTSTQRKALQLYSANQGLSMLDANADYLGAIDTYA